MILSIVIAVIIAAFASYSFYHEFRNYKYGLLIKRAKRRMTINICLLMVAIALVFGYAGFTGLKNQHELFYWGFLCLLMLAIIWLAWIDLKEGLKEVEKKAMEDIVSTIHEIKKRQKDKNDPYHKDMPIN